MKKVIVCCSAGLTSSSFVKKLKRGIEKNKLDISVTSGMIEFNLNYAFYDAVLIAPQISFVYGKIKKSVNNERIFVTIINESLYFSSAAEIDIRELLPEAFFKKDGLRMAFVVKSKNDMADKCHGLLLEQASLVKSGVYIDLLIYQELLERRDDFDLIIFEPLFINANGLYKGYFVYNNTPFVVIHPNYYLHSDMFDHVYNDYLKIKENANE